jgi:hypothetical protein
MHRLAGIKKTNQLNESFGGYVDIQPLREMGEENKMEAKADTSWESLPRETPGKYLVKVDDWKGDEQSFLDAIETVKSQLEQDKTNFKYGVKLAGEYKKGIPTVFGDWAEIQAFVMSEYMPNDKGNTRSKKEADDYIYDKGMLRPDRFREGIEGEEEEGDKQNDAFDDFYNKVRDGEGMEDDENPFPSMQDETGDPIQMAIQNLKSMFPGITDADIAEYLETYQEYQSVG